MSNLKTPNTKITLGEMVSFLPLPGTFFALANRNLSPSIVSTLYSTLILGLCFRVDILVHVSSQYSLLITSYAVPFPLVAASNIMSFWIPKSQISPAVWISVYFLLPITFNLFNVRRYGELEFWLTSIKVLACIGLIFLGILLPMDASTEPLLLGTNSTTHEIIQCLNSTVDECVAQPGFKCIFPFNSLLTQTGETEAWRVTWWEELLDASQVSGHVAVRHVFLISALRSSVLPLTRLNGPERTYQRPFVMCLKDSSFII